MPTRVKRIPNTNWWWLAILKNASTTMERMTVEERMDEMSQLLAIIRNPYDRLISCWENKGEYFPQETFHDFIQWVVLTEDEEDINPHVKSQAWFIDNAPKEPDMYINMDNLATQMSTLGIVVSGHHNQSDRKRKEYYTVPLRELVRERYSEDFEIWEAVSSTF